MANILPGGLRAASLSLALAAGFASAATAEEGEGVYFGAVTDPTVKQECSACHMAFSAGMLPATSWKAILGDLSNHYGEDASLHDKTIAAIRDWLTGNAAQPSRWMTNAADGGDTPMRITETTWWTRVHDGEVNPAAFDNPRVGSRANCAACHRGAEQGFFGEE